MVAKSKLKNLAETGQATEVSKNSEGTEVQVPTDAAMRDAGMKTLSARIRHLDSLGIPTAEIARVVKRENGEHPIYQHVRNVLNTPLKKDSESKSEA